VCAVTAPRPSPPPTRADSSIPPLNITFYAPIFREVTMVPGLLLGYVFVLSPVQKDQC
jgi:hypothetical protein